MKEGFLKYWKDRTKKDKIFTTVLTVYFVFCLFSGCYWIIDFSLRNFFMSMLFLLFIPAVYLVEYFLGFRFGGLFLGCVLFIAMGGILGTCFDFYSLIPFFDNILHGLSGFVFACLGFSLGEKFFGKAEGKRSFFGCLLFGVCFSLAIAVVWELFEYACTAFFGFDMMEDSIVTEIRSYLLAGGHNEVVSLTDITQTIVYYGDGKTFVLNGYLDIGLLDTLHDMIVCTVGAVVFVVVVTLSKRFFPKCNEVLIPQERDWVSVNGDENANV